MFRGEFIRGDGLVIPNNITKVGAKELLQRAIQDVVTMDFHVALVRGVFTPDLQIGTLPEPTFTNGYVRKDLVRNEVDWPTVGEVNDEWYVESKALVWAAVGGNFSEGFTRMAMVGHATSRVGNVFALSGALPEALVITPATPVEQRTYRYRIYMR